MLAVHIKMKKLLLLVLGIFLISLVSGANWKAHPLDCPNNYQAQTCPGSNLVCGYSGGVTYCYDMSSLNPPGGDDTSQAGDTYQSGLPAGFIVDCYAYDGSEPHCDNSGGLWCNRNVTCYTTNHRTSICKANKWSNESAQTDCGLCRSDYYNCYGDTKCESTSTSDCEGNKQHTRYNTGTCVDGSGGGVCQCDPGYINCTAPITTDGCEVDYGTTNCAGGAHNNINQSCVCVCDSNYYNCDASAYGGGTGCEVNDGGSCSVGSLSGTYSCSASAGGCYNQAGGTEYTCSCVVDKSYFQTGTFVEYLINIADGAMLWFKNWGTGPTINATDKNDVSFIVNESGAYWNNTDLSTSGGGGGNPFDQSLNQTDNDIKILQEI